jgi:hypothetical protein
VSKSEGYNNSFKILFGGIDMRITLPIVITSTLLVSGLALASTPQQKEAQEPAVVLYSAPEQNAQVLEKVAPTKPLIPIFRQKEWVKVGDPRDGKVGWVNKKQYRQAMRAWYRPNVKTVFIRSENNKNGKPEVNIIAYSNGKKLNEAQAKALYKQLQKNENQQWRQMNRFDRQMNKLLSRQMRMMDDNIGPFAAPFMTPVIIINQPAKAAPAKKQPDQKQAAQQSASKSVEIPVGDSI